MYRLIVTISLVLALLAQPFGTGHCAVRAAENTEVSESALPPENGGGGGSYPDEGVSDPAGDKAENEIQDPAGDGNQGGAAPAADPRKTGDSSPGMSEGSASGETEMPAAKEEDAAGEGTQVPSEEAAGGSGTNEEADSSSSAPDAENGNSGAWLSDPALSDTAPSGDAPSGEANNAAGAAGLLFTMIDSEVSYDDVSPTWGGDLMGMSEVCARASRSSFGGRTVTVAVIDTGVNTSHELLAGRITGGKSFLAGTDYSSDENGHGTHVAGIIAENTPSNVRIMPLKVLDADKRGTVQAVHDAIRYAASNGADIINLSLGLSKNSFRDSNGTFHTDDYELYEATLSSAIREACGRGCVVIASAGNEGSDLYEIGALPAGCEGCITVSALSYQKTLYRKSNYGGIDFCAPGEAVYSSYSGGNGSYEKLSGTSMAVPFISAAYALLMLYNPDKAGDTDALTELLAGICEEPGPDSLYGYGLPVFADGVVPCDRPDCPVIRTVVPREDSITLKWEDQDGISYDIFRKADGEDGFQKAGSSDSGVFTDSNVSFNQSYTYYIEAFEPGHYSVSDRSEEVTARAYVAVTGISCRTYDPYDLMLSPGKSLYLHAAPVPISASFPKMIWTSENPEIATVTESGRVTAVSEGTTRIIIRSEDSSYPGSESYEVSVVSPEKCGDDLYWYFDEEQKRLVILGEGDMYDFTANSAPWFSDRFKIRQLHLGEDVTGIGENAFPGVTVTEIEGTGHIDRIGSGAFRTFTCYDTFPLAEGAVIAADAFESARLQKLVIPSGLTVDERFFARNSFGGFETEEDCRDYSVRDGALLSGDESRLIRYPYSLTGSFRIPETVTEIAPCAFKACTLASVQVPGTIDRIPDSAFESCYSLKSAALPDTITSIGAKAFYRCASLEAAELPPSLTYIGPHAFYRVRFDVLEIPASLTQIGAYALAGMEVSELHLPEGVTSLGEGALQSSNSSLQRLYLPASLARIGKECFDDTFSRSQIHYNGFTESFHAISGSAGQDYLGSRLIVDTGGETGGLSWRAYGESGHVTLTISGSGALPDYRTAQDAPWAPGRSEIERVVVGEGVTYLGKNSLCQMPSLKSLELPASVTGSPESYGYGLFLGDSGLEEFVCTFPEAESVTVLMSYLYGQYNGRPYKPPVIVRDSEGADLSPETGFRVAYQNTESAGQGSVRIDLTSGEADSGSVSVSLPFLVITDKLDGTDIKSLSSIELSPDAFTYDGSAHFPIVTVKSGIYTLQNGSDYRLSYPENCVETGRYTITATGIGVYTGTKSATFVIEPSAEDGKASGGDSGKGTGGGKNSGSAKETDGSKGSGNGKDPGRTKETDDSSDSGSGSSAERSGNAGPQRTVADASDRDAAGSQRRSTQEAQEAEKAEKAEKKAADNGASVREDVQNASAQKEPSPEEGKAPDDGNTSADGNVSFDGNASEQAQEETSGSSSRILFLLLLLPVLLYFVIRIFRAGLHRE
ncbi:MAG TPA: hypothetical protein DCF49_10410 [Lachnospiraceae bacterium]|nr:hypothetical protein [Lachnospiraceae bacterium]